MRMNAASGGTYVEPYAGGAGVALALLFGEQVDRVIINDADASIYAFWKSILTQPEPFVELLQRTPATVAEWRRQREIYLRPRGHSRLRVGFATFYLNRCNRSGIISSGGPIGGTMQTGEWKIDARLNRAELAARIRRIASYANRITVSNADAVDLLANEVPELAKRRRAFVYLDPPYYAKGQDLYLNFYAHDDHAALAAHLSQERSYRWLMSYDNVREIRDLYRGFRQVQFSLDYSARERRVGKEVMIFRPDTTFPRAWKRTIPSRYVSASEQGPPLPPA